MRSVQLAVIASLSISFGIAACNQGTDTVDSQSNNATAATTETVDDALWSKGLQSLTCKAIVAKEGVAGHDGECTGFDYRVVEVSKSTKYTHASDSRPITMQMKVDVENPGNGASYEALLTRVVDPKSFALKFNAEISKTQVEEAHDFIKELADDAGEYGDFWDEDVADRLNALAFNEMPDAVQTAANSFIEHRQDDICEWEEPQCSSSTGLAEEGFFQIMMGDEVVGYVLSVWDYVDHPLFDGAGVYLYYDADASLVTDVEWTG